MKHLLCVLILIGWSFNRLQASTDSVRVVFYNVENFFDAQHDSLKQDDEFLPGGLRGWSVSRFFAKAGRIARVIASAGDGHFPDLIGMAEVENKQCLEVLTKRSPLKNAGYSFIHEESSDARGVDVCLLYNRYRFQPITHKAIRILFPDDSLRRTRDVLYVRGVVASTDTIHIFVCHFPSRLGGQARSEKARRRVSQILREEADELFRIDAHAKILIMGDFNDYPENHSLALDLKAGRLPPAEEPSALYNLMADLQSIVVAGTHKSGGEWGYLDQLIVSGALARQVIRTVVFAPDFLLVPDETNFGKKPFRTYEGMRYTGGYSDHLPVFTDLRIRCQ